MLFHETPKKHFSFLFFFFFSRNKILIKPPKNLFEHQCFSCNKLQFMCACSQVVASLQRHATTTWWQQEPWCLRIRIAIDGTMPLPCCATSVTPVKQVSLRTFEETGISSPFSTSLSSSYSSVSTALVVAPSATQRGLRLTTLMVIIRWPKFDQDGTTTGMLFSTRYCCT